MLRVFKICRLGGKEIAFEEADNFRAACRKAGLVPEECEIMDVTDQIKRLGSINRRKNRKNHPAAA